MDIPRRGSHAANRPRAVGDAGPYEKAPEAIPNCSGQKQNPRDFRHRGFVLALPIFPGRLQPSIVGRSELNFRVRDGNGWTLALISTNSSAQQYSVMPT